MESGVPKKTGGRRKIQMKKIVDRARRQVTFTKRHQGLFKKAAECSVLCGVGITILAKSPGGKLFTFSSATPPRHPVFRSIFGRVKPSCIENRVAHAASAQNIESRKAKNNITEGPRWWERNINDIHDLQELQEFTATLVDFKNRVSAQIQKSNAACPSPPPLVAAEMAPSATPWTIMDDLLMDDFNSTVCWDPIQTNSSDICHSDPATSASLQTNASDPEMLNLDDLELVLDESDLRFLQ